MEFVEFQVKGSHSPEFKKLKSLFEEKVIKSFKDGERFICFVKEENKLMDTIFYEVEDIDGTIEGTLNSKYFFKITEFKNHSKRYNLLKQTLRITDK